MTMGLIALRWSSLALALLAAPAVFAARPSPTSTDPRACIGPPHALASARDSAAYCAAEYVARNGYTDRIPTSDRSLIAVESWDQGRTLQEALEFRRGMVRGAPLSVCESDDGYRVVFHVGDARDDRHGRVVVMTRRFGGLRLLAGSVELPVVARVCAPPGR